MKRYMHMKEASFSGIKGKPRVLRTAAYFSISLVISEGVFSGGPGWSKRMWTEGKDGPTKSSREVEFVAKRWRWAWMTLCISWSRYVMGDFNFVDIFCQA